MVIIKRSDTYLEHHGILKQKWGVRNAPPYPLDYNDHSAAQKKANPKSELNNYENNNVTAKTEALNKKEKTKVEKKESESSKSSRIAMLMEKGLSEEQAKNQIAFEKRALAITAVTAAAIGAAATYNLVRNKNLAEDFVLSSGTEMFRVASSDSSEMRDMFYATTNKLDSKKYAGIYAKQLMGQGKTDIYQKVLSPKSDIKIAGSNTGEKIYNQLVKDPEFDKAMGLYRMHGLNYDDFNKNILMVQKNSGAAKMFFDKLQQEGYGGIIDVNDSKYSGYNANRPVILFNQQSNISTNSVNKLSKEQINNNARIGMLAAMGQQFVSSENYTMNIATLGGIGLGAAGKTYLSSMDSSNNPSQVPEKK